MANFPAGAIYIWTGTNATIPSGWERVTALDGKYPKGTANATNPNQTGGNTTHEHTSDAHTHTMAAHTHTITIPNSNGPNDNVINGGSTIAPKYHNHADFASGAVTSASISNATSTYSAISNEPPYYSVIFITPTVNASNLPDKAIYLYDGTDSKSGHYLCDGNNSTPNLVDKYLKGAGTGADAGTTGGSTTNVHNLTHTHTVSHAHASQASPDATLNRGSSSSTGWVTSHTHTVSLNASTTAPSDTPILTTTETVEPAYKKLLTVQNRTGHDDARMGMIGMWLGTLSSIPSNYLLCDGTNGTQDMRGKYHKSTATTGEVGDTGGSNTHTHSAQGHTHNNISHTHTPNPASLGHSGGINRDSAGTSRGDAVTAVHNPVTASTNNYSLDSANTTANSASNEPQYRTVAFIKLNRVGTAAMLLNLI
jgi:hypothetical protein